MTTFQTRNATQKDAAPLAALINAIIAKGGTTAHEVPFTPEDFAAHYLEGPDYISCVAAEGENGALLGFQSLSRDKNLPPNWGDIGTFTAVGGQTRGVGTALFRLTVQRAKEVGVPWLHAIIRADNMGGLAYYSKMGFMDFDIKRAVPLKDGTVVDRVRKRFEVI